MKEESWYGLSSDLANISYILSSGNRLAAEERCLFLSLGISTQLNDEEGLFRTRLDLFMLLAEMGRWADAEEMWLLLDPMGRDWDRLVYQPGYAEYCYASLCFWRGQLTEEHLCRAERLAETGKSRFTIRSLHTLRGAWQLENSLYKAAAGSFHEAVRMAREVGQVDPASETLLALARDYLGQLPDPRQEAEQLAQARNPAHNYLSDLWFAIGDRKQAEKHALAAYKLAWADGEPYVLRHSLNYARAILDKLRVDTPRLTPYDPAKAEKLRWEDDVAACIQELRAES